MSDVYSESEGETKRSATIRGISLVAETNKQALGREAAKKVFLVARLGPSLHPAITGILGLTWGGCKHKCIGPTLIAIPIPIKTKVKRIS